MRLIYLLPLLQPLVRASIFARQANATKPAAFFLAGDSTTAKITSDGGGWGDGFLGTLVDGAIGINWAQNGATAVSFVKKGNWTSVMDSVAKYKGSYTCYVTIQFGHNDQKAADFTIPTFAQHIETLVTQVRTAGGIPIVVTSISRRDYNASGLVAENLANVVEGALEAAASLNSAYIDLNKASTTYLDAIGKKDGNAYDLNGTGTTHLNAQGGVLFGNMVAWLLQESSLGKEISPYVSPNATILSAIKTGTFILPDYPAVP